MSKITGFVSGPTTSGLLNWYAATLDCGHKRYSEDWQPYNGSIGDDVDCHECEGIANQIERLKAIPPEIVHHARYDYRFGGSYHLYRQDRTSPSGFMLIDSFQAVPQIDAILRTMRVSPLSPTER